MLAGENEEEDPMAKLQVIKDRLAKAAELEDEISELKRFQSENASLKLTLQDLTQAN